MRKLVCFYLSGALLERSLLSKSTAARVVCCLLICHRSLSNQCLESHFVAAVKSKLDHSRHQPPYLTDALSVCSTTGNRLFGFSSARGMSTGLCTAATRNSTPNCFNNFGTELSDPPKDALPFGFSVSVTSCAIGFVTNWLRCRCLNASHYNYAARKSFD